MKNESFQFEARGAGHRHSGLRQAFVDITRALPPVVCDVIYVGSSSATRSKEQPHGQGFEEELKLCRCKAERKVHWSRCAT